MAGLDFNDGHYAGPEQGEQCLFAGWSAISPGLSLVSLWSLSGLSLVAPGLVGTSDLLVLYLLSGSLAPVPTRARSDHITASLLADRLPGWLVGLVNGLLTS